MKLTLKTDVAIIGSGPSGLLLSRLLKLKGISSVIVERQSITHVLSRIRAGVLEQGSVDMMQRAEVGTRVSSEGLRHDGFQITYGDRELRIDLQKLMGKGVTVYGQTEVTKDLYHAVISDKTQIIENAGDDTAITLSSDHVKVTGVSPECAFDIEAKFVAGCDGYRGISRQAIPVDIRQEFERIYPFGWLGVLSETKPADHEIIYSSHENGFAMCSMRNANLSRYYVQCPTNDRTDDWSDERFWATLKERLPSQIAQSLEIGPSIEKSIAPLRSFVCEPLSHQRIFIAGDAGHIVPPTGAKGLNLAFSDIFYLSNALVQYFSKNDESELTGYSDRALARIWKAERFSWWMTSLLHKFDEEDRFAEKMRRAEFQFLCESPDFQRALAENYVGLPY